MSFLFRTVGILDFGIKVHWQSTAHKYVPGVSTLYLSKIKNATCFCMAPNMWIYYYVYLNMKIFWYNIQMECMKLRVGVSR